MKPAILTIILGTTVLLAHVVGWGWEDDDYDTDYNDYMDSLNDEYEDYYMYDQYGEKETKCGIKPKCPKINAGKCARELLQKENVKGKRRNKMRKEIEKDLRNHWCSEPRNITNGNVETPCGTGLLQTAKYSCIPGYKLIPEESDKSQCKLNKKWSGKIPVCKSGCGKLTNPDNGVVSQSGAAFNAVAHYSCTKGYTLFGPQSRCCSRTGNWTGTTPTCEPINCGKLTNPENGEVLQSESTYGAEARYNCSLGYRLDGSQSRFCSIEGNWFGTAPKCVQINCGTLTNPENGEVLQSESTYGAEARYTCRRGYRLDGSQSRFCSIEGNWFGTAPKCVQINCGTLTNPENGEVLQSESTYGAEARYSCLRGYRLDGSQSRFCSIEGNWFGTAPKCVQIKCALPESPCNGKIDPVVPEKLDLDSVITYSCHHGYVLEGGSKTRKCTPMGWDGHTPCCVKDFCDPNPCQNGGSCGRLKDEYNCDCAPDYSGVNCQIGPNCTCAPGYGGVNCLMENKAFRRPASQSPEHSNKRPASLAVDGDRRYYDPLCTHTAFSWKPWWMVDLESFQRVNEVHILNRGECCGWRLRNLDMYVSNDTDPTSGVLCMHYPGPAANGEILKLRCCPPQEGRYVRLQVDFTGWEKSILTLCEVEVY